MIKLLIILVVILSVHKVFARDVLILVDAKNILESTSYVLEDYRYLRSVADNVYDEEMYDSRIDETLEEIEDYERLIAEERD